MQFCSGGAKHLEAKKFDAVSHGVVLDSDLTDSLTLIITP